MHRFSEDWPGCEQRAAQVFQCGHTGTVTGFLSVKDGLQRPRIN
jgi:hypothetical protein